MAYFVTVHDMKNTPGRAISAEELGTVRADLR
jgi:hypothetical protein